MLEKYDPKKIEPRWQREWDERQIYRFDFESSKPIFSIDTPPPYASAYHLHMGHAMHYSQFEFMARFWRMRNYNVFFPIGFDDNGLPTEKHVEEVHKVDKSKISREEFKKLCMEETEKIEEEFMRPMFKHLGFSCDWDIFYRTIDPWCQKVAQMSFLDLHKKGYVYRSEEPTLWCPYHQTALAQAEVEDLGRETTLNYIDFELEDGEKRISIATTRPEFLPACVGIFVHPEDERHGWLVGRKARVPIFGQEVPIMEDPKVDPEFGTGIVMICTFGDSTDIAWWKTHNLPLRMCIDERGMMTESAGEYAGLSIEDARERILEDLESKGFLKKKEKLEQVVGACWRCDTPVEFIVTEQWFIKTLEFKEKLIEQGRKIKWHPDFYRKRYENWVENLAWDWCISRQRYFGIPIPVWYCEKCGEVIVAREEDLPVNPEVDEPPVKHCPKCKDESFTPDLDVFDTWMTSSMTPQIATKWNANEELFKRVFPMTMRPQAHDIIRTWAFYTIFKAWLHHGSIPWRDVMMSGHGLDEHGKGMSKSKGNVVLPEGMIEKYSADAVRFWASSATLGEDLPYREKDIAKGQKFLNKLWNASRFVGMHLEDYSKEAPVSLELLDKWILARLHKVVEDGTKNFERYRYSKTKVGAEQFFWHDFCDDYIEMVKHRLYNPKVYGDASRNAAQQTLYQVLLTSIKLLAPIVPHITEEIYQEIFDKEGDVSVHVSMWPNSEDIPLDARAQTEGELVRSVISRIRRYKADKGLPLNHTLSKVSLHADEEACSILERDERTIKGAMQIERLEVSRGKVKVEKTILEIVPDYSTLGPEFKGAAKDIIEHLSSQKEDAARELKERSKFLLTVKGKEYEVLPRHIKEIKSEVKGEGEADIVEVPEHRVTILIS
ncbi:MAG: valine--tRNA ligase [Candidatus Hydrothermarchaeales archaeon]